ncbi:hypothetical protein [Candidatus Entotheonella palauensis]|uniref:hypothetical protein n=1 Tax=Candidatus Entotheonella palauensis TaxID=93172 RepID=UPI0015C48041|nr:hypothetical protein [Candidatus Entotheonella palauensis]
MSDKTTHHVSLELSPQAIERLQRLRVDTAAHCGPPSAVHCGPPSAAHCGPPSV